MSEKERFLDRQSAIDFIVNGPIPEYDALGQKADEFSDEHRKWSSVARKTSEQIALLEEEIRKLEIKELAARKIADGSAEFSKYTTTLQEEIHARFERDPRFNEWLTEEAIADAFGRRYRARIHAKTESIDLDSESSDA